MDTELEALAERVDYIAAILTANAAKFSVPDHIPAKVATLRKVSAILRRTHSEQAGEVEAIERDIRIAIWNAGKNGGMGDDLSRAFINRAMAEPSMQRAVAALSRASTPPVESAPSTDLQSADDGLHETGGSLNVEREIMRPGGRPTFVAVESAPTADAVERACEAECARLLAAYLRREIGELMRVAEHWAENGVPHIVHHHLIKADSYFQIVCFMEREPAKGCSLPFDQIREELAREPIYPAGKYPPSKELYRYRDPTFVASALAALTPATPAGEVEKLREHIRDFRWRANQCRTNPDAFDTKAAAIWDLAADELEGKK